MRACVNRTIELCVAMAIASSALYAQARRYPRAYSTRAELESLVSETGRRSANEKLNASDRAMSTEEEKALRARLRDGDFRVGDRIIVRITGGVTAFDTLSVTPARALTIPEAGDVSLDGVLRSELQQHLNAQLGRYLRNATVHAEPLTRLAVLGEVRTPGFVHVPSQALLSDVVSAAGGPTATASLSRVSVRRNGITIFDAAHVAKALTTGVTIDDLGLRAGDEIVVAARRSFNWTQALQTTAIVLGSVATVVALQHR